MSKLANAAHLGARYDQSTYSRIRVTIPARLIKPEDNRRIHNVRYFNRSSFSVCSAEVLKALLLCSTACSKAMLRFSRSVAHCAEPMNFNPRVPWGTRQQHCTIYELYNAAYPPILYLEVTSFLPTTSPSIHIFLKSFSFKGANHIGNL